MDAVDKIPTKYRYRNAGKGKDQIFSYDSQGWPLYKQTIRDFLIGFGLDYNEETNMWQISDDDKRLDCVVRRLCDDGMGYGVNEEFVSEVSSFPMEDGYWCNMFTEPEVDNIEIWNETKFHPGAWVSKKDKTLTECTNNFCLREITKDDEGEIIFIADQYCHTDDDDIVKFKGGVSLLEEEIEWA